MCKSLLLPQSILGEVWKARELGEGFKTGKEQKHELEKVPQIAKVSKWRLLDNECKRVLGFPFTSSGYAEKGGKNTEGDKVREEGGCCETLAVSYKPCFYGVFIF